MAQADSTTDHDTIRQWAEARGGHPARVRGTGDDGGGLLRIDFDPPDDSLERIEWDEFFAIFDDRGLTFLYQDKKDSRFTKLVNGAAG